LRVHNNNNIHVQQVNLLHYLSLRFLQISSSLGSKQISKLMESINIQQYIQTHQVNELLVNVKVKQIW